MKDNKMSKSRRFSTKGKAPRRKMGHRAGYRKAKMSKDDNIVGLETEEYEIN
jgi:hypothetical protein